MAQQTALSISALPGKPHSFLAKTEAAGVHTGLFTALSPSALPGGRRSFIAKTPEVIAAGPHTGLFTSLSVMSLPGGRHTFVAKTEAVPVIPPIITVPTLPPTGGAGLMLQPDIGRRLAEGVKKQRIEDEDLMDILAMITASGILDE